MEAEPVRGRPTERTFMRGLVGGDLVSEGASMVVMFCHSKVVVVDGGYSSAWLYSLLFTIMFLPCIYCKVSFSKKEGKLRVLILEMKKERLDSLGKK